MRKKWAKVREEKKLEKKGTKNEVGYTRTFSHQSTVPWNPVKVAHIFAWRGGGSKILEAFERIFIGGSSKRLRFDSLMTPLPLFFCFLFSLSHFLYHFLFHFFNLLQHIVSQIKLVGTYSYKYPFHARSHLLMVILICFFFIIKLLTPTDCMYGAVAIESY